MEHEEKTVVEYRRNDLLCKDKSLTKNHLLNKFWLSKNQTKKKALNKAVFSDSGLNNTLNSGRKEFRLTSDFFKATFTVRRKGAISTRFSGIVWLKTFHPDEIQVKRNGNLKYSPTCFWISSTKKNKIRLPYSLYRSDEHFIWKLLKTQELNPS